MALRLIEIIIPGKSDKEIKEHLKKQEIVDLWRTEVFSDHVVMKLLAESENIEIIINKLCKKFSSDSDFRIVVLPVEATIPRPEIKEKKKDETKKNEKNKRVRISKEELYSEVTGSIKINYVYILMMILSTVVASVGLIKNNIPIIIGAMVIAPLLGPSMALSLSTTMGDPDLGKKALKSNIYGITAAFIFSILLGILFNINPIPGEIIIRTDVGLMDILVALAAGSAGSLAFTTDISASIIGVMVSVSLLPALASCGLLMGSGNFMLGFRSLALFFVNFISINLAGVITFVLQGIKPNYWWEEQKAKKATRTAIIIWVILLFVLTSIILLLKS